MNQGTTDFEWLMSLFEAQCQALLGDEKVWLDEGSCPTPIRLRWPWPKPSGRTDNLRYLLATMAFTAVMDSIKEAEEGDAVPVGVSSARFQLILRMVRRTVEDTIADGRQKIGPGRISGTREFKNKVKEWMVQQAVATGKGVMGAGVKHSPAYRAVKRARGRA